MTKQDFLAALERALAKLPHAEAQQAIAFYDEAISDRVEDGMSENDAVASLGDVDEIARQDRKRDPAHSPCDRQGEHRQPRAQYCAASPVLPCLGTGCRRAGAGRAMHLPGYLADYRRHVDAGCHPYRHGAFRAVCLRQHPCTRVCALELLCLGALPYGVRSGPSGNVWRDGRKQAAGASHPRLRALGAGAVC